jgi:hypothetical protein
MMNIMLNIMLNIMNMNMLMPVKEEESSLVSSEPR